MDALLILAWLTPLAAAVLAPAARFWWLPAFAALPALAAAALVPSGERVEIPWLLLGSVFGLDDTGRIFLAFTSVLWLAAGLYCAGSMRAGPNAGRFRVFYLLAMAGNLWLIVGLDLASFYLGFSLMGLASYGLVIQDGDRPALRAGKVYLVMALLGELALFVALVLVADHVGGLVPDRAALVGLDDLTVGLLLVGLAIKAGLVPLHVWLPLAHPAAPVPASAVLSGAMIKVALLGWLRFLPVGETALIEWGLLLVFVGLLTLFFAIPIGMVQSNPKVILAYSSVSKMGLMALTLGLLLLEPDLAVMGILALSLYAAHHALVKGGLFLGVGLRHHASAQWLVLPGIAFLALSLAAVPFSGGAVVKYGIKPVLGGTDWSWLVAAVALSTAATALLMLRFLWVILRTEAHPAPGYALGGVAWAGLIALGLLFGLTLGTPDSWVTNALPTGIAFALALPIALTTWRNPELLQSAVNTVRPGDLLGLIRPLLAVLAFTFRTLGRWWQRSLRAGSSGVQAALGTVGAAPADPERDLRAWPNAGAVWLLITVLLLGLAPWAPLDLLPPEESVAALGVPVTAAPGSAPASTPAEVDGRPSTRVEVTDPAPSPAAAGESPVEAAVAPDIPSNEPALDESAAEESAAQEPAAAPQAAAAEAVRPPSSGPISSDEQVPVAPTTSGEVKADQAPEDQDPEERSVEPEPLGPDQTPVQAVSAHDAAACDPGHRYVVEHPDVAGSLRFSDCVRGEDGPRRLAAPPLTNALVDLVQRHLQDLGYDPGPLDGLLGPRTRDAIRRFQRDHGLEPNGAIDFPLLDRIGAETAADTAPEPASAEVEGMADEIDGDWFVGFSEAIEK